MRVLLLGAGGQLGQEVRRSRPADADLVALARADLDICDSAALERAIARAGPDVVVNAAAYTAVDRAEEEPDRALAVNGTAVGALGGLAASHNIRVIQLSTDFVFDGAGGAPYGPDAEPHPIGAYGRSKLAGERALLERCADRAAIIRTAWLYAGEGHNFVRTMLRLMAERGEVRVVDDQIGTPTWARGLAETVWTVAARPELSGILHWTDGGVASWYDFAVAIGEEAAAAGLLTRPAAVTPVATAAFPQKARRPRVAVLDKSATIAALGRHPPHWRQALREMLSERRIG